jgi:hypothetical protein
MQAGLRHELPEFSRNAPLDVRDHSGNSRLSFSLHRCSIVFSCGLIFFVVFTLAGSLLASELAAPASPQRTTGNPFECQSDLTLQNHIDELVFARLQKLSLEPAGVCSDAVFVRRVYLDVIGTLPTVAECTEFLAGKNPNKRSQLIERLLQRDEFADYWAMKWSDLLRVKAEFPINLWPNAAQAYHHWIRSSLRENMSYDRFVRELLTSSGSNFRRPPVNFYRAMQNHESAGIAQTVALTFMGTRADKWPKEQLDGMAAFFSKIGYKQTAEWKEEIILFDAANTNAPAFGPGRNPEAVFPDGTRVRLSPERDPREVFADWLVSEKNPWFTRNIANRVWSWLLGRGIIQEPDDIRPDNPPSNPELLAFLEQELIASHYDLKQLYRQILNSKTYQLSSLAKKPSPEGEVNFAYYPLRRLEAEVMIDALNRITGTTEKYSSAIPEPFTFIPESQRSISLPDGSVTSPFLELFGRPPRDTGLESERNNRPTSAQSLHLLNSSHIQRKLEEGRNLQNLVQSKGTPRDVVAGLYLMMLSRYPTDEEWRLISAHASDGNPKSRETLMDLAWALVNSAEFLYRH